MAGMKQIKTKIKSVSNIKKMTKALEIVSTIKLQKMKQQTEQYRNFLNEFLKIAQVVHNKIDLFADFHDYQDDARILLVVLSTDKGLCGAINSKLFKSIHQQYKNQKEQVEVFAIGKKAKDFFTREWYMVVDFMTLQDEVAHDDIQHLISFIHLWISDKKYSSIEVCFNYFHNPIKQTPVQLQLLPFDKERIDAFVRQVWDIELDTYLTSHIENKELLVEPGLQEMRKDFMNQLMEHLVYGAILQNKTGEFASRMLAMKNAKDNASEVIDDLTLTYNKIRQGAITQEISEIVSAKVALE